MSRRKAEDNNPRNPRNEKPISLYPMKFEDALRRAMNPPRPPRQAPQPKRKPEKH